MRLPRFIVYLAALAGAAAFYVCYLGWYASLLLAVVLIMPVISLIYSLGPMRSLSVSADAPRCVPRGTAAELVLRVSVRRPVGYLRLTVCSENLFSGEKSRKTIRLRGAGSRSIRISVDTTHCGAERYYVTKIRAYDLLGIFHTNKRLDETPIVYIAPLSDRPENAPDLSFLEEKRLLRPKPGGGLAEEHDVRGYLPGDPMTSVHWKLSAKTDGLVVREPLLPHYPPVALTADLSGSPDERDASLDTLRWLSGELCARNAAFSLLFAGGRREIAGTPDLDPVFRELLAGGAGWAGELPDLCGALLFRVRGTEVSRL